MSIDSTLQCAKHFDLYCFMLSHSSAVITIIRMLRPIARQKTELHESLGIWDFRSLVVLPRRTFCTIQYGGHQP